MNSSTTTDKIPKIRDAEKGVPALCSVHAKGIADDRKLPSTTCAKSNLVKVMVVRPLVDDCFLILSRSRRVTLATGLVVGSSAKLGLARNAGPSRTCSTGRAGFCDGAIWASKQTFRLLGVLQTNLDAGWGGVDILRGLLKGCFTLSGLRRLLATVHIGVLIL